MAELYNINNFLPQYLLPRDCELIQSLIREEVLFLSIYNITLDDVDDDDEMRTFRSAEECIQLLKGTTTH